MIGIPQAITVIKSIVSLLAGNDRRATGRRANGVKNGFSLTVLGLLIYSVGWVSYHWHEVETFIEVQLSFDKRLSALEDKVYKK